MYKTINGWTKAKMKKAIKKYNNGTLSARDGQCVYKNSVDNNRCAVGCFLPEESDLFHFQGSVIELFNQDSNLKEIMPLRLKGLSKLQLIHDNKNNQETNNMHKILFNWIDKNVRD